MKHNLIIKIRKKAVFAFLVIFFFLQPSNFFALFPAYFPSVFRVGQALILFALGIKVFQKKEVFRIQLLLIMSYYLLVYGISMVIKSSTPQLMEAFASIGICIYIAYAFFDEQDDLVSGFSAYYMVYALIEILILIILKPDPTKYDMGLFYNRNHLIRFFLPGTYFVLMNSKIKSDRYLSLFSLAYLGMISFIILYGKSATGLVGLGALIILLLVFRNKRLPKYLEPKYVVLYTIAIFIGIYVFHIERYFEYFITVVLHRDATFTGRTYIWTAALSVIRNNIVFGVGSYANYGDFLLGFKHAHQYWLQCLLSGGIIGTAVLLMIYSNASNSLRDSAQTIGATLLCIVIDILLIIGIDEALTKTEMLIPLLLMAGLYKYCFKVDTTA